MQYIILGISKILDNVILTLKSIYTYKNKKILSSLLVIISQLMFYTIIKQVIADDSIMTILVVSIASGIGNYIAFIISDKFKKDDTWTNIITSSNKEMLVDLCTMLREHKVKYLLYDTYNRNFKQSYTITAFTKTKAESKLIDEFLDSTDVKFLRMINGIEVKRPS